MANSISCILTGQKDYDAKTAETAKKLSSGRIIQTNLGSTSGASFDGTTDVSPGVQGILGVYNGGTGATSAAAARSNLGALAPGNIKAGDNVTVSVSGSDVTISSSASSSGNEKKVTIRMVDQSGTPIYGIVAESAIYGRRYSNPDGDLVITYNLADVQADSTETLTILFPFDVTYTGSDTTIILDVRTADPVSYTYTVTTKAETEFDLTSSLANLFFSSRVTKARIWMCGGGGGGGASGGYKYRNSLYIATGGSGAYTSDREFDVTPGNILGNITIGVGGTGGTSKWADQSNSTSNGSTGGSTSLTLGGIIIMEAKGGQGGLGLVYSFSTTEAASFSMDGVDGGSGVGGLVATSSSDGSHSRWMLGNGGSNGANGEGAQMTDYNNNVISASGGAGQGTTTKRFGESEVDYCGAGGNAFGQGQINQLISQGGNGASPGGYLYYEDDKVPPAPTTAGSGSGGVVNRDGGGRTRKVADGANGMCSIRLTLKNAG